MGRGSGAQTLEQKPEPLLGLLLGDAEQTKDLALQLRIGDPKAAAAQLGSVEDHVVGQGAHLLRSGYKYQPNQ